MSKAEKKKEPDMMQKYSIGNNYRYVLAVLGRLEGRGAIAVHAASCLIGILQPFCTMALPSVVVALLTGGRPIGRTLCLAGGYVALLRGLSVLSSYLSNKSKEQAMMLRVDCGKEFFVHCLEADSQFMESAKGRKKVFAAQSTLYQGNDYGIEKYLLAIREAVVNLGGLCLYIGIAGGLDTRLLLFLLCLTGVSLACRYRARQKGSEYVEKDGRNRRDLYYLNNTLLSESYGKDIRLYQMKRQIAGAYDKAEARALSLADAERSCYMKVGIADQFVAFLRDALVYGLLIGELLAGRVTVSGFLLYTGAVAGFGVWSAGLAEALQEIFRNNESINHYRDFIRLTAREPEDRPAPERAGCPHEIRLEHVSFSYDGQKEAAVQDLNLTIRPGEKLALVGQNGAGKTTLIKLLCGIYRPQSGKIYLDGQDISSLSREAYQKEFSVVFQEVFAFSFALSDNVSGAVWEETEQERLQSCLKNAGLWERVRSLSRGVRTSMNQDLDSEGVSLSGGELQKLMLARALYKDAPVIVLDEPTAALDPLAESEMYEKYYSMTQDKTSIFISHRLSSTQFCDRILYMENGRICEEGSHESLLAREGSYARLFHTQARYYRQKQREEECYA